MIEKATTLLKDVFGYDSFRPLQREVIENVLKHRDTLVIMPTGGGKSLCYQIPALLFDGLTVVVSPLISLMKDQVEQLTELGIDAVVLNSTLSPAEYRNNTERVLKNEVRLLYLAPETLLMQRTLTLLSSLKLDCLTIDEAHCISEWGHDFRPEYRQLIEVRKRFPKAVCTALTATATPRVQQDIMRSLQFESSNEFISSFNRGNLFLEIVPKAHPIDQTIEFLNRFPDQSGIVYCFSRRQVDELTEILAQEGFSVMPYHAGLTDEQRHSSQDQFIKDDIQIIVATIAFGMGIDKPNIRFVLHYDLPNNIESYYQQIGRAGRDGLRAHCRLLFGYADIQKIKYFINQKVDHERRVANIHLSALVGLAETDECRRIPLLQYFGEEYTVSKCDMCDNCLEEDQQLVDMTVPAQKFLSCVKRTGQMFGAAHIIDVLRGSQAKKVIKFQHEKLATYGIGNEYSKKQWFHLSRQFIQKGLLNQDLDYGSLKLTPKAWDVLKGHEQVHVRIEEEPEISTRYQQDEDTYDHTLFELLRKKRKALADRTNLPPYIIFPDKTLMEMATFFPQSSENLLKIHGVGVAKFEKYGQIFITLIHDYCQENHIVEIPKTIRRMAASTGFPSSNKRKYVVVGEAYNSGKTLEQLCKYFDVKMNTIFNHLYEYLTEGHYLRQSQEILNLSLISEDERKNVFQTFDRIGFELLRPVFEALEEKVDYNELRLLRLYYLIENQEKEKKANG
jgi:ATP-dependent DNA helicase RecQ